MKKARAKAPQSGLPTANQMASVLRVMRWWDKFAPVFGPLANRWDDEICAGSLTEFAAAITAEMPRDFTLVHMLTTPAFGFLFRVNGYAQGFEVTASRDHLNIRPL
jgi:hypothetical protein